jgi:ChrR Cupin-like domain
MKSRILREAVTAMGKAELEFTKPDHIPWQAVTGSATAGAGGPGITQKILSRDEDGKDVTRLLKFEAGVETGDTISHDFWEEVWILEGELIDLGKRQTFTAGMYACRPPGMRHGPYRGPKGCITLEFRYHK